MLRELFDALFRPEPETEPPVVVLSDLDAARAALGRLVTGGGDTEALVTGVGAQAAQSLIGLGLDLRGLRTHRTLAEALAWLIKNRGATKRSSQ